MKRERQKYCKKSKSKPEVFCIFYSFGRTKTLKQIVLNDLEVCIFVLVWFDFSAIKDNRLMVFWTSLGPQKSMFNLSLRGSFVKALFFVDFQPFS